MPSAHRVIFVTIAGVFALGFAAIAIHSTLDSFARSASSEAEEQFVAALLQRALDPSAPATRETPAGIADPVATLSRRPLDTGALARAALSKAIAGENIRAGELMNELLRRDPRSRSARMWLAAAAMKAGNLSGAVTQLDRLLALDPELQSAYFPVLAALVERPGAERPLAEALARNPPWSDSFLAYLTTHDVSRDVVFRLTPRPEQPSGAGGSAPTVLLQSMVARGEYDAAYLAWINFLPEAALAKAAYVYDGDFAGLPGPQPFNWMFSESGKAASVGIERGRGLQIDFSGAQSVRMASQTLLLTPGRYRFDYVAHGSEEGRNSSGTIGWYIQCLPGKGTILDLQVAPIGDRTVARAKAFAVPAGCEAQLLFLEGTAGEFPATRSISFSRVSVTGLE